MRVLAVRLEDDLFDQLKAHVRENGVTLQEYVPSVIENDLKQNGIMQQETQEQHQEAESTTSINSETEKNIIWEKEDVEKAIDGYILKNGRVPSQKEFKNENGLPSYKAATRSLGRSPAEHCHNRYDELNCEGLIGNDDEEFSETEGFSMSM